jgi:sec-independent protein translocase protein TatA
MGSFSPVHWLIVIVIVLLVFGPGRLAGVGKGLGEGIRQFKKGLNEDGSPDDDKPAQPKAQLSEKKDEA